MRRAQWLGFYPCELEAHRDCHAFEASSWYVLVSLPYTVGIASDSGLGRPPRLVRSHTQLYVHGERESVLS